MIIEAAAEAFREFILPAMGMLTIKSQLSRTSLPIPSPSEPITIAQEPVKSVLQSSLLPPAAAP